MEIMPIKPYAKIHVITDRFEGSIKTSDIEECFRIYCHTVRAYRGYISNSVYKAVFDWPPKPSGCPLYGLSAQPPKPITIPALIILP